MTGPPVVHVIAKITGKVQGVFFRASARRSIPLQAGPALAALVATQPGRDRKSTRLNSSHNR
jgi:hypothetical protein